MKPGRIAGKGGMRQKTAENSTGKRNNVENFIEIVVFAVLVGIASAVTLWLFYRQCVESMLGTGLYHSDMKAYILEMQGLDSGYSFPYPILFKLAAVIHLVTGSLPTGTELAMALATMLLNSAAMIALKIMLDRHVGAELRKAMPGKAWLPGVLTGTVAVSLFSYPWYIRQRESICRGSSTSIWEYLRQILSITLLIWRHDPLQSWHFSSMQS